MNPTTEKTMSDTKKFPARVLLTVTTGRLLTKPNGERDNGIRDLYDILGWMTNDSPFTHQLVRFADECKPHLARMFPELEKVESAENLARFDGLIDSAQAGGVKAIFAAIDTWLEQMTAECGLQPEYEVPRIPDESHEVMEPISELAVMMGKGRVS